MKYSKDNILVIGDTHIPFEHKDYLDFCLEIRDRCKCGTIVHIGDLVDNHAISYHEPDPNGWSPLSEMEEADKHLKDWFKAFPKVNITKGNHDILVDRKGKTIGLPRRVFQQFRHIWKLPAQWKDEFKFIINGVVFEHGTRCGKFPHVQSAYDNRCSTVIGHAHSVAGCEWSANHKDCIFGMSVGCGIDVKKYTFAYGKGFRRKPVLACAIVTDKGEYCQVFKMRL